MKVSNFKFQIVLLFLFSFFYLLPSSISAQATQSASQETEQVRPATNPEVPNTLHNWTQTVMIETMSALTCQIAGVDPVSPNTPCLGIDQEGGKIGFLPQETVQSGGAIGFMGGMIAALYTPPLHTSDYFNSLASNFGIVKNAQAQTGTGFDSLNPLVDIWTAFRNIVYLFLVIIFIVIGLAIMLRVKIDPRTVMTIQNQIPKILIGILLVTFSFAIAGFLIDLMWVSIYLIFGLISSTTDVADFNPARMSGNSPFEALGGSQFLSIPAQASAGIGNFVSSMLGGYGSVGTHSVAVLAGAVIGGLVGLIFGPFGALIGALGTGTAGGIGGSVALNAIVTVLAFLIILIAFTAAIFRLWFTLLIAYVQILLAVVLAPFWIIGGIVPGSPIGFGGWVRNIGANLLAFPATITLFMLAKIFMDIFGNVSQNDNKNFVPPLIGNPADASHIGALIGLGIILMTPNVVSMLQEALKSPKVGTGVGGAIGAGTGITGVPGKLGQLGLSITGMKSVPGLNKIPGLRPTPGAGP